MNKGLTSVTLKLDNDIGKALSKFCEDDYRNISNGMKFILRDFLISNGYMNEDS